MIDFNILEQFVTFYHTGTLIETAEILHISQSTLTRNIQKIESEFDVLLFNRTKNSISFNESGKKAVQDAEMLLHQYKNMLWQVQEFDRHSNTIYIGSCAPAPTLEVVQVLTTLFPNTAVSSELNSIPALVNGLQEDKYQFIILPTPLDDSSLFSIPLSKEQIIFSLPQNHRYAKRKSLSTMEMNGEDMLLFQDIGFWYDLVKEKMPDSRFLLQTDRYSFMEIAENSTLPFFTTEVHGFSHTETDRVKVPIKDSEFFVTYHLLCKKENKNKFNTLFSQIYSNNF